MTTFSLAELLNLLPAPERRIWGAQNFSARVMALSKYYADLSARGIPYSSYFTLHDEHHIDRILKNMTELLVQLRRTHGLTLSPLELFLLVASAYTHDIGMFLPLGPHDLLLPKLEGISKVLISQNQEVFSDILSENYSQNPSEHQYAAFIRDFHHWRSGIFVRDVKNATALQIAEWRGLVALIAEGHRKVDLYNKRYSVVETGKGSVRTDLLTVLLRVADELDVYRERVPNALTVINSSSINADTRKHWVRHYCTEGLVISSTPHGSLVFEVFYKAADGEAGDIVQKRIRGLISDGIDAQLRYVNGILARYGIAFPQQVNTVVVDKSVGVLTEDEVSKKMLLEIFFEREFAFRCPALQKHLELVQMVTIEQRGNHLICIYDENEHKKGAGSYCTASSGALLDCGFCAVFGTARIHDKQEPISFFCPIYSININDPQDRVTLNWTETEKGVGKYVCSMYATTPQEYCHHCGFGGESDSGQEIRL